MILEARWWRLSISRLQIRIEVFLILYIARITQPASVLGVDE
jgi:hypothetical protein